MMPGPPERSNSRPELARDLGVSHASAVVVGTIIGSGIFLVPAEMMQAVGSAKLVYLAWVVGGLLSFFGALTYAELGAMKPQAGGEYVYVRDGYGPLAGFLYAWTWFVIAKPGSIATVVTGLVRILGTFPVFSFFSVVVTRSPFTVTWGQLFAIAAAILISLLNYLGVKKAGQFQLVFTLLKVAIILGIVVICFSGLGNVPGRGWSNFGGIFTGAKGGVAGFMAALVAALWAYDGWNDLNMVAGEVKRPERNIPIALIAGVAAVGPALRAGQCWSPVRASCQCNSGLAASRVGCRRVGHGADGRQHCFGRHGGVDAGHTQWHHHERRANPLRGGSRRIFFSRAGGSSSPFSHAGDGDCGAGDGIDSPAADRSEFSTAFLSHDFCRVALLHDRGQHCLYIPAARAAGGAPLSHVGLSFRADYFRSGGSCPFVLHLQKRLAKLGLWRPRHTGRNSCICLFLALAQIPRRSEPLGYTNPSPVTPVSSVF